MKYLYTLTGNLLAETTALYESVSEGNTHRAVSESFQVGGKGINVAKMAQRLGTFSTAVCFPGGHTGNHCTAWLNTQAFAFQGFQQTTETRSGWVVRDAVGHETSFLGCDRIVEEEPWTKAIHYLARKMKKGDMLAICGSIPGWRRELADPLSHLLDDIAGDVFVAVDTYGPPLTGLLRHPIDLLKINRKEFQSALPGALKEQDFSQALIHFGRENRAVKRWVITAGNAPVVALDHDEKTFEVMPPPVKEVSAVGSGDVLLAGLIHYLAAEGRSLKEALASALPLAAANAARLGLADFDL